MPLAAFFNIPCLAMRGRGFIVYNA